MSQVFLMGIVFFGMIALCMGGMTIYAIAIWFMDQDDLRQEIKTGSQIPNEL